MKVQLELNILDDGRCFLNFWDSAHGNDVVCEVVEGSLVRGSSRRKMSLEQFIKAVEKSASAKEVK